MREFDLYNNKLEEYKKEQKLTFDELVFEFFLMN